MAIDFPASPTVNQVFTSGGQSWTWDGTKWNSLSSGFVDAPSDGNTYGRKNATWNSVDAMLAPAVSAGASNTGRNLLHNGRFYVWQRGFQTWTADGAYTADRWQIAIGNSDPANFIGRGVAAGDGTAIGDEDIIWFLRNTFTGAATGYHMVQQKIENPYRTSAKTVTLSFYARAASGTPKLGINFLRSYGTGGSPSAMEWTFPTGTAVTISTNWARYSATFAIPSMTGKTYGSNLDGWLAPTIWYSCGSAGTNPLSGNIGQQSNTIDLWGVQLEIGNVMTALSKRDPADDLALCQRFYQLGTIQINAYASGAGTPNVLGAPLAVTMRASPTFTPVNPVYQNATAVSLTGDATYVGLTYTTSAAGNSGCRTGFTASADL